jgi:hypothetical protein
LGGTAAIILTAFCSLLLLQKGDFRNFIVKKLEKAELVSTQLALTQQYLLLFYFNFD